MTPPLQPSCARAMHSLPAFALHCAVRRLRQPSWWWFGLLALTLAAVIATSIAATGTPKVELASEPLYAATNGDKPAMTLALSVEYPTVGAQYTPGGSSDNTYDAANEYLGYYDAEACYRYNDAPTETPASPLTTADYKRFDRVGKAIALAIPDPTNTYKTSRMCSDAFSGNFLNWATSSAIDMLRLALSGGDRYIDTAGLTILQRAVLPNGNPTCMWNSNNFPAKQLPKDGGGTGKYWGAVPAAMINAANGSPIWVANTLNQIYFKAGASSSGSCGGTGDYRLTAATTTSNVSPITSRNETLPADTTKCGDEGGTCSFSGIQEVWYGANGKWNVAHASNGVGCTNAVFGDPISGTVKACYRRAATSSWTPSSNQQNVLNSDGFFYSRVQVCNVDSGGNLLDDRDYGLCKVYPNGKYKPGGAIQKYSDQLRLAAFGYLLDQVASYNSGRYGGVLRAPMKYVGAKTFDEAGVDNTPSGGNPNVEWNTSTGVFIANPDNHAKGISGVINYLNKFGRTGTAGLYKIYDPVGEMYYQAVRYLQGLQPSPDAVSSITTAMEDGYPVYTTWTDPFGGTRTNASNYACVKNNIVVIGDINTHDAEARIPAVDAANNIPDIKGWRSTVQAFERNSNTTYIDGTPPNGVSRTTGNPNGTNNSVPTGGQTSQIMGTAYWAHTHDIRGSGWTAAVDKQRPGLRVKTFLFDVNEYGDQNNANTRRYANQFFMAAKYGGFETDAANLGARPYNTKGNPFQKEDGTNDNNVWQKQDAPGEASTYYLQSGARGVLSAFDEIFSRASSQARSIAGAAASTANLRTEGGGLIYQAAFDTSDWSGDLLAYSATANSTSGALSLGAASEWSANEVLTSRNLINSPRNIVVGNAGAGANPKASNFVWDNNLSTTIKDALDRPAPDAAADGLGSRRLAYLRGIKTDEGSTFRLRTKLLGDIINSGVAYSGAPSSALTGAGYGTFADTNASRVPAVFVGANDGMLHAFNANTGTELFGYIPSWLVPKLSLLTSKTYVANHTSYVDATPVVAEADFGSASSPDWRTVLVSGTGAGGKGIFGLDVTDPSAFGPTKVLWEFTSTDDADMGNVIGRPRILKLRTSAPGASVTYKWYAVVAGGVNGANPSLFVLDLAKPAGTAWTLNSNYYKMTLPVDSTLKTTLATGVVNFSAELGTANEVVRIYTGDLHGRLWRLEFKQAGTADWTMDKLTAFSTSYDNDKKPTGTPLPLYIAVGSTNQPQTITMAPSVIYGGSSKVNYIAFSTGKYMEVADKTDNAPQSFYALYDDIDTLAQARDTSAASGAIVSGRSRLKVGTLNTSATTVSVASFKWGRRTDALVTANSDVFSGWYFDFPVTGERGISNAVVNGSVLQFNTLFPSSTSASTCGGQGGGGNSYSLDITTGNGNYTPSIVEVLGEPLVTITRVTDANANTGVTVTPTGSTGRAIRTITSVSVNAGSKGLAVGTPQTQSIVVGRLSWRRINNYEDLK